MIGKYTTVLSIAGSDSCGGAGIQADVKTISALGSYAATAITAVTVQNTCGVRAVHTVPAAIVKGQIEAVMEDISPAAVKIGMVNETETVRAIVDVLRAYPPCWLVVDPVMVSTSGHRLMDESAVGILTNELFPMADLITPNLKEAEWLLNRKIETVDEMKEAAHDLLQYGCKAVLLKGGHLSGHEMTDILQKTGSCDPIKYKGVKTESRNTHGTGCTLSSAIATLLAQGLSMEEAVGKAKAYVSEGIRQGKDIQIGHGYGPLNHFFAPVPMKIKELF